MFKAVRPRKCMAADGHGWTLQQCVEAARFI
jgi:hypothetical protein